MIEVIRGNQLNHKVERFEQLLAFRYDVFVRRLGWDLPIERPGRERDRFDTPETIHFLDIDEASDRIRSCARINPTTEPHLMSELFGDFCDLDGVPCGVGTFELSRWGIEGSALADRREIVSLYDRSALAILSFCRAEGIKALSWLSTVSVYGYALRRLTTRPLGTPQEHPQDRQRYIAALTQMDLESLLRLQRAVPDGIEVTRQAQRFARQSAPDIAIHCAA